MSGIEDVPPDGFYLNLSSDRPFHDYELMCSNLAKLGWTDVNALRVSKEHYTWLSRAPTLIKSIIHTVGGTVEGHPTSEVNILQRLRELVRIEAAQSEKNPAKIGWMGDISGGPHGPSDR